MGGAKDPRFFEPRACLAPLDKPSASAYNINAHGVRYFKDDEL